MREAIDGESHQEERTDGKEGSGQAVHLRFWAPWVVRFARRLRTSVPQLYRLLDTTNTKKSINQLVSLLQILDCSVDLIVTDKEAVAHVKLGLPGALAYVEAGARQERSGRFDGSAKSLISLVGPARFELATS